VLNVSNLNHKNIGDDISIPLLEKVLNKKITKIPFIFTFFIRNCLFIGSILKYSTNKSTILGSGFNQPEDIKYFNNYEHIIFVRGKLSQSLIKSKLGINILSISDPAILVSRFFDAKSTVIQKKIIIIPNHYDEELICHYRFPSNVEILSNKNYVNIDKYFRTITSAELILSSSLHGIVFADSYGKSSIPFFFQFSQVSLWKFYDYFSSSENRKNYEICSFENIFIQGFKNINDKILPKFENINKLQDKMLDVIKENFL